MRGKKVTPPVVWSFLTGRSLADYLVPRRCLTVFPGSESVSLFSLTLRGGRFIGEKFLEEKLGGDPLSRPAEASDAVLKMLSLSGIREREVSVALAGKDVIVRRASFPASVRENLADAVYYELDRLTPLRPEELYYGYLVTDGGGETCDVLICAVRRGRVEPFLEELKSRGVIVSRVSPALVSLGMTARLAGKTGKLLFLEGRGDYVDGALVQGGKVIAAGSWSPQEGDSGEFIWGLVEGAGGEKPLLCLSWPGEITSAVREEVEKRGIPFEDYSSPLANPDGGRGVPPSLLGSSAETLLGEGIDLLGKRREEKNTASLILSALLTAALILSLFLGFRKPIEFEKRVIARLDARIRENEKAVTRVLEMEKEASRIRERIETVEGFKTSSPLTLVLLREVTAALPETSWVTRFFVTGNTVEIQGEAESAAGVISALEKSPFFRKVEYQTPTFRDQRTGRERFNIRMEIEGREGS
ncbi:MAG: hypothetical protein D6713_07840 [Deltaproteobacteria bacterium]|nr:MAG: hypothetical protein D6713_07840 [Deltaproteobacteria bacterium]